MSLSYPGGTYPHIDKVNARSTGSWSERLPVGRCDYGGGMTTDPRPAWAQTDPLLGEYYDKEWGSPVTTSHGIYERLVLEGFQSGLSWLTVLKKRPAFREVFADFDPATVAEFGEDDVARLMNDARIIRNERKICAAINNAQKVVDMEASGESFAEFVLSFAPDDPLAEGDATQSAESVSLSKALKKRGFTFVGPVTMFALMQAIGMYNHRHDATTRS